MHNSAITFVHVRIVPKQTVIVNGLKYQHRIQGLALSYSNSGSQLTRLPIRDGPRLKRARTAASPSLSPQNDRIGRRGQLQSPPSFERQHDAPPTLSYLQAGNSPKTRGEDTTWREHSIVAEFGDSSSAMDITRRVSSGHRFPACLVLNPRSYAIEHLITAPRERPSPYLAVTLTSFPVPRKTIATYGT